MGRKARARNRAWFEKGHNFRLQSHTSHTPVQQDNAIAGTSSTTNANDAREHINPSKWLPRLSQEEFSRVTRPARDGYSYEREMQKASWDLQNFSGLNHHMISLRIM